MIWILQAIAVMLSVVGTPFVVKKKWQGHAIWACANVLWIYIDVRSGVYLQAALFGYYLCAAVWGALKWRKDQKSK